jgi:hypothetical protein
MSDFEAFVEELGEEVLGTQWLAFRGVVRAWAERNPERVAWMECRIRDYGRRHP